MNSRPPSRIRTDDRSITVIKPTGQVCCSAAIDDVQRIVAYKDDVFAYDVVCLAFVHASGVCAVQADEEMHGWEEMICSWMPATFPGIAADWFQKTMLPPFERCETLVWRRA